MDWNFNKLSSGYISEFDQESIPDIPNIGESISFGSPRLQRKGDFSFDLKLGNVGNSSVSGSGNSDGEPMMSNGKWKESVGSKVESSLCPGPVKRARGNGNGIQTPFCLVDGCDSDLSNCREYHKRHKVCEVHSKTSMVTINGQKQRFCQQCSRFHSLEEFDEGKRSCRKRLDGHNRRRRKPQPDPVARPSSFLTSLQGIKLLQFSNSNVFPTTSMASPGWNNGGIVSAVSNSMSYERRQNLSSNAKPSIIFPISSSSSSYKATEKRFPFLQDENNLSGSHNQTATATTTTASTLCERLTSCISDSDCALSLLSSSSSCSSSHQTLSPNIVGLRHNNHYNVLRHQQPNSVPLAVQSLPSLTHEPVDSIVYGSGLLENAAAAAAAAASDGSVVSGNESVSAPQTFPFYWE